MKTILFQGDSITDVMRQRDDENANGRMGYGYPLFAAGELMAKKPEQYAIYNRGISGNRIVDVYARIKADIINLKPDYMSILIGVNDVWHEFANQNGVDAEKYEKIYSMLIEEIKSALPDIKIIILEPFTLKGEANKTVYGKFRKEVELRAQAAKRIAENFGLTFIPLQAELDSLAKNTDNSWWLGDGVHPTPAFHRVIADKWLRCFEKMEK